MLARSSDDLGFSLYDEVGAGILIIDIKSQTIIYANREVCNLSLYDTQGLVGKKLITLFASISHGKVENLLNLIPSNSDFIISESGVLLKRKSGSKIHISISVKQMEDKNLRLLTLVNIQPRRELENKLEQLYAQMIHTSKFLSLAEMAAGIAHEINNPLAIAQAYAEQIQLRSKLKTLDSPIAVELSQKIVAATQRASKIIKTLKKLSRSEEDSTFEDIPADHLIAELVDLTRERIIGHRVEFQWDERPELYIHGSSSELLQVLINLIENALHVVRDREVRKISLAIEERPTSIVFKVNDSGPGVPKKIQKSIMNPFFTTKEVGQGTGLGLSISKMIIEKHSGRLFYEDLDPGASFCVEIPKAKEVNRGLGESTSFNLKIQTEELLQVDQRNSEGSISKGTQRILIVDDEKDLNLTLKFGLEGYGYQVKVANDGVEAIELLKTKDFDGVITDIRMPNMNGFHLIEHIFALKGNPPKVFILTGSSDIDSAKFFDKGIEAVFFKPVSLLNIVSKLESTFKGNEKYLEKVDDRAIFGRTYDLTSQKKSGQFNIGRGGVFISSESSLPKIGSIIKFKINILGSEDETLSGLGIVRWTREKTMESCPRGLGVEFYSFDERNNQRLLTFLKDVTCQKYIPMK